MIKDNAEISKLYQYLSETLMKRHGRVNWLLDTHKQPDYVARSLELFEMIRDNCEHLDEVSFVACSDPIPMCYMLNKYYGCDIKLLSDHPILEETFEFYETKFGAKWIDVNPLFDDFGDLVADSDLVVFHDYEYFVPLGMIRGYGKNKLTAAAHYVSDRHLNAGNSTYLIDSEDEFIRRLDFRELIDKRTFKTIFSEGYCALGLR